MRTSSMVPDVLKLASRDVFRSTPSGFMENVQARHMISYLFCMLMSVYPFLRKFVYTVYRNPVRLLFPCVSTVLKTGMLVTGSVLENPVVLIQRFVLVFQLLFCTLCSTACCRNSISPPCASPSTSWAMKIKKRSRLTSARGRRGPSRAEPPSSSHSKCVWSRERYESRLTET